MLRTSARRREDTWPLLPPVPPKNTWNRGIGRVLEAALMFGWEATTLRRSPLGSGQTALTGKSNSGIQDLTIQDNQTGAEMRTA